jgi:hypothetical protein
VASRDLQVSRVASGDIRWLGGVVDTSRVAGAMGGCELPRGSQMGLQKAPGLWVASWGHGWLWGVAGSLWAPYHLPFTSLGVAVDLLGSQVTSEGCRWLVTNANNFTIELLTQR